MTRQALLSDEFQKGDVMNRYNYFLFQLLVAITLTACGNEKPEAPVAPAASTEVAPPAATEEIAEPEILKIDKPFQPPNLPEDETKLIAASGRCVRCHTDLDNGEGIDYSFDTAWRSSMMAHSGKDPYWLATMSVEIDRHSEHKELVEDKCATCHMPLAHFESHTNEYPVAVLGEGFRDPDHPLHDLAADGVSCTLCHQIGAENLGQEAGFSGGYTINEKIRIAYGTHSVIPEPQMIMLDGSGYDPRLGEHFSESALCATCHTLYTPYLNTEGEVAGHFPEQMVYQEWENSAYNGTKTCQECHMPKVTGYVAASNEWGPLSKFTRLHTFTGANAFMLRMLNANAETVGLTAEDTHMQAAIERVTEKLQTQSAELALGEISVEDGMFTVEVTVNSLVGHKFPSGFPSRRAWLHLTVTDETGAIVFESGAVEANGMIVGNDNDVDHTLFEPHYVQISSPDQVQIYEAIMTDTQGQVTTSVLLGAAYAKDNRLLPDGFHLEGVDPDIAPYGAVNEDADFTAGGDIVTYQIDINQASGTLTAHVELLYQSVGYRWAENLRNYSTMETEQFFTMYDAFDNVPVVVAETVQTINP
jgi:hypothetical protein